MLSGIKRGKKKKLTGDAASPHQPTDRVSSNLPNTSQSRQLVESPFTEKSHAKSNKSVADELRQGLSANRNPSAANVSDNGTGRELERRGRIHEAESIGRAGVKSDSNEEKVLLMMPEQHAVIDETKDNSEMTIREMMSEEIIFRKMSQSEMESRNLIRLGKKRKMKEGGMVDSDEEEEWMMKATMNAPQKDRDKHRQKERDRARLLSQHDRQSKIASRCWWWIDSGSDAFQRHRLIALGDYVTLVMAPIKRSIISGKHFYLVPIPHVESLASCDDHIWNEILLFQKCLHDLFNKEGKSVVYCETILPNQSFWQTKLECIAVPSSIASDAQLYFRSALMEVAEEWGTHQKIMKTTNSTNGKDLRRTIPSKFSYVYLQYDDDITGDGYVQMIESAEFPKDFAVDTVAGMMKLNPLRLKHSKKESDHQSKSTAFDEEKEVVLNFLKKWNLVDWTTQLDEGAGAK